MVTNLILPSYERRTPHIRCSIASSGQIFTRRTEFMLDVPHHLPARVRLSDPERFALVEIGKQLGRTARATNPLPVSPNSVSHLGQSLMLPISSDRKNRQDTAVRCA